MRVDDGLHIWTRLVHPQMEARGRVGHAVARQGVQVAVDFDEVRRRRLVKAQAEAQGPVRARARRAHADLSRQAGFLLGHRQDAAGVGHGFLDASRHGLQMARHFLRGTGVEIRFLSQCGIHGFPLMSLACGVDGRRARSGQYGNHRAN
ncbi:hypothetical protein G6F31_018898 [Rhizopus arrhizus]|nr:hypothetical protein G6F31_018898 [Rhizopus arrhizus]